MERADESLCADTLQTELSLYEWVFVFARGQSIETSLDHGKKDEVVAKVEAEEAAREDEEDSGMEREDTPSNIELNHLRKVIIA